MNENLKNLHILSKTYKELYKCCETLISLRMNLEEKVHISKKKNFKELLKKYNKTKTEYLNSLNIIKNKIDDKSIHFSLLQNNLKIKSEFIEKLESKKLY